MDGSGTGVRDCSWKAPPDRLGFGAIERDTGLGGYQTAWALLPSV